MLEFGKEILAGQPFSRFFGAELTQLGEGRAEIRMPITDQLKQHQGFLHGGAICYIADTALTFAGASTLKAPVVTADLLIHYIRPGIGEAVIARASVMSTTRRRAVCRCDVFVVSEKDGERLCATAQGSVSLLGDPPKPAEPKSKT